MRGSARRLVRWAPRILGIGIAAFVSVFALDVLDEGFGSLETALALLTHLIPTAAVLAALALSWRRAWVGGVLFTGLGVLHVVGTWGRLHWSAYVAIAGPLVLTGVLFLIEWRWGAHPGRGR